MKRLLTLLLILPACGLLLSGCSPALTLSQLFTPAAYTGYLLNSDDTTLTLLCQNDGEKAPVTRVFDRTTLIPENLPDTGSEVKITLKTGTDTDALQAEGTPLPARKLDVLTPADEARSSFNRLRAAQLLDGMSLEEKVGQLFFARYPGPSGPEAEKTWQFGGTILFGRDFKDKSPDLVRAEINACQEAARVPMLVGVDEEGGDVVRVSGNPALRAAAFPSPQTLLQTGGLDAVTADAHEKDALLKSLNINVNFAPVCDLSQNPADYIYSRTTGQDADATAAYVTKVVSAMTADHMGSVLKHFPGYGPGGDTHKDFSRDGRPLETFEAQDFLPFKAGVQAGAGSVLVSHNVIEVMDPDHPASLSPRVHEVLRNELGFDGVVLTDDLDMEAITKAYGADTAAVQAVAAGNDMILSSRYTIEIPAVIEAVKGGTLSEDQIDASVKRVLIWKMALGLL
ncbi:glycoside hydrolase family 3 N-terminal domain-containing protein [Eubacterium sp. 1001713B170207_170306_E7]|uniref:glycoside hydrolase family 3 protein n=1 Tax=Eubacterium sp. 1001713B170207_170306_E7 TaxID=2787097 RepID=UPI00189A28A5|nr:glycoside hydrolase family 3 N-terminal domain-containing protein [Eubacterium sp. 1001713B170207_170306_E7]